MTQDLVIFGTGGFAREVLQVALDQNEDGARWNVLGFLDDAETSHGSMIQDDYPVLGGSNWMAGRSGVHVMIGIGRSEVRRRVDRRLRDVAPGTRFATLIHPLAWLGRRVEVGEGTVICAGTLITTDIMLGRHVLLNLDCTVGHDAVLEDYASVAPSVNISGTVRVGEGCELGTGSTIIQGRTIGAWTIVGAGSVVVRDLPPNVTAVGAPAKPIKENPPGPRD